MDLSVVILLGVNLVLTVLLWRVPMDGIVLGVTVRVMRLLNVGMAFVTAMKII
jgi:hypothetical protein